MNTMYRNTITDYGAVKGNIFSSAPSIFTKENIKSESSFDKIVKRLQHEKDDLVKEEFDKAVEELAGGWPEAKKSIKTEIFDMIPKAQLHVHGMVGLSVDDLGELIIEWNSDKGEGKRPEGAPQIVYSDSASERGIKVLMYDAGFVVGGEIRTPLDNTGNDCIIITDKKQWDDIKSDFYLNTTDGDNWEAFNSIFTKIDALYWNKDFYYRYYKKFFEGCRENGIKYIELRTGFQEFVKDWKESYKVTKSIALLQPGFDIKNFFYHRERMISADPKKPDIEFLEMIYEAAINSGYEKNDVRVILTANRNKKGCILEKEFYEGICMKADAAIVINNMEHTNIPPIAGFDLVNQEDSANGITDDFAEKILYSKFGKCDGDTLGYYYADELNAFTKSDGISRDRINMIRYFFHDGESTEKIISKTDNAITGPVCARYRIGHGFKMGTEENFDFPSKSDDKESEDQKRNIGHGIADYILYGEADDTEREGYPISKSGGEYIRKDIIPEPVFELCPISNYMLGYVEDLRRHPAIRLMDKGIFMVICSDDPQIFDNPGLSYDYAVMYKSLYDEHDEYKAYNLIKLSAFLGFFYREMSKYYYKTQSIDSKDLFFARDDMTIGQESDKPVEENETDAGKITEWSVFNKAVGIFNKEWDIFVEKYFKGEDTNEKLTD